MNTYYDREDQPKETPETALADRQQQASALDGLVTQTAQELNTVQSLLGALYDAAEKRGDQAAMQQSSEIWALAQQFAVRITLLDADRLAGIAFGGIMAEFHQRLAREKDDLESDYRSVNRKLQNIKDERWAALGEAYEDVFHEMHIAISQITGCQDWAAVYRVGELLTRKPDELITARQRAALIELVNSVMEAEAKAS